MNAELEADLRSIIHRASRTNLDVVHRNQADLTQRIQNNEDRAFTLEVVDKLRSVEPDNRRVAVDIATNEPTYIYVWASGYRRSIDLRNFAQVINMQHPVLGSDGIANVSIQPSEHGLPTKFIVQIRRSPGMQAQPSIGWHDEAPPVVRKARKATFSQRSTRRTRTRSPSPDNSDSSSSSEPSVMGYLWEKLTK